MSLKSNRLSSALPCTPPPCRETINSQTPVHAAPCLNDVHHAATQRQLEHQGSTRSVTDASRLGSKKQNLFYSQPNVHRPERAVHESHQNAPRTARNKTRSEPTVEKERLCIIPRTQTRSSCGVLQQWSVPCRRKRSDDSGYQSLAARSPKTAPLG